MSEEERDWIDEERLLNMIYIRRGYSQIVAKDMAQREIEKRKIECGYLVNTEKTQDKEVEGKAKSKTVKSLKKGVKE